MTYNWSGFVLVAAELDLFGAQRDLAGADAEEAADVEHDGAELALLVDDDVD
jgi:hypothetical protein